MKLTEVLLNKIKSLYIKNKLLDLMFLLFQKASFIYKNEKLFLFTEFYLMNFN